ncbi:MAG: hypothetical protein NTY02_08800, partial [Acidobacteria bacterium]|nr:hypothetical protein [Acidobacteriota bacterium]
RTRVTLVWEPVPPIPGEKREDPARVELVAGTRTVTFYRGPVPADAGANAPAAEPSPAAPPAGAVPSAPLRSGSKVSFDAAPGKMTVRISVQNDKGQVLDSFQQEAVVPDFSQPHVKLSTPVVLRARTAREFQSITRDPDPVPTSLREFRRTDRLLIRVTAHGGGGAPELTAKLLNRVGQKMVDLAVQAPAEAGKPYQVDLPLAGLAPGEFVIELRAATPNGDATELIAIKVVS